jgi:CheY-like chemotaxis protein
MQLKRLECDVVVVDDSPEDRLLLCRALKEMTHFRIVHVADDGQQAIRYFSGQAPYDDRVQHPCPHLLILDLMMPRMDGFAVLQWLRDHATSTFVIVVLTGLENPGDTERAKALGADAVFIKPVSLYHLRDMMCRVERFMETAPKNVTCEPAKE